MPIAAAEEMALELGEYTHDPLGFARVAYPWGERDLSDSKGPRQWQSGILRHIAKHLGNSSTRHTPLRIAVASGHGIGKSAELSMVTHWAMSTCDDCKVVLTANTATQLATKTAPEVGKWFRLSVNAFWWDLKATSITFADQKHGRSWRADFIPWSEHNTEAFAGLHNKGKRIVLIFDEASAIADPIWDVAEGALTDEGTEIIWLAFGNPTQNTGRFRECFGRLSHRWKTFQIDSRTVEGTNKEQISKWEADYGPDSDFFRTRVRGEFPLAASTQFIASDVVERARSYRAEGYDRLPRILACDVARFGDDQTVNVMRQGRYAQILGKYRGLDTEQVAQKLIEDVDKHQPDATIIDGDGIGGGVIDHLNHRGYREKAKVFPFHGGASPNDPAMWLNKRAEVWGAMRDWLQAGAQIPDDPELAEELTAQPYDVARGKRDGCIFLLSKQDMKEKMGLRSPDCADALAMTFGVKVAPKPKAEPMEHVYYPGESNLAWLR